MKRLIFSLILLWSVGIGAYAQIYVAGYEYSYADTIIYNYYGVAKYWKNGVSYTLAHADSMIYVKDIAVVDTMVYVVGNRGEDYGSYGKLWINGVEYALTDSGLSWGTAIAAINGDVYITGSAELTVDSNEIAGATLWKNGTLQLIDTATRGTAYSVFISDTDVYILKSVAPIGWKVLKNNETVIERAGEIYISEGDMYISEGDIYVAGLEIPERWASKSRPILWKNGTPQYLDEYHDNCYLQANAICIIDTDIYVAGRGYIAEYLATAPVVWKNGVLQAYDVGIPGGEAVDIAAHNGEIYVLTYQENRGYVWKNDVIIYVLEPEELAYMQPTALFLVPDSLPNIGIPQIAGQSAAVKLYPNPANSYITIELPKEITDAELQLFDMQGRALKQENITTKSTLDISWLQSGIYLYKVVSKQQQYNGKLLITR